MPRSRLRWLVSAGLVDSFGLALGWTVFNLFAVAHGGLEAVGFYGAALLVGVALSAPITSFLSRRCSGRRLLRLSAVVEGALRLASLTALVAGAPGPLVALLVALSGLAAWTGFAGMRAEVAASAPGVCGLTRYMGLVAAVEAAGAALAATLPAGTLSTLGGPGFESVLAVYVLSLVPTYLVARDARVARAPRLERRRRSAALPLRPLAGGFLVMAAGSGPTFLAVGLAAELYGRSAVAFSAAAFTVGALLAPRAAALVERTRLPSSVVWPALGTTMAAGWVLAPVHLTGLIVAQLLSGLALSAFEGSMDSRVAGRRGLPRTADLARTGAARALGSAVAIAAAPALIAAGGVSLFGGVAATALAIAALAGVALPAARRRVPSPAGEPLRTGA